MLTLADSVSAAAKAGRLRAEHFLHFRCEVSAPNVMDEFNRFKSNPDVRLASVMDHAPGQRQFQDLALYEKHHRRNGNMTDEQFRTFADARIAQSDRYSAKHRAAIAADCNE